MHQFPQKKRAHPADKGVSVFPSWAYPFSHSFKHFSIKEKSSLKMVRTSRRKWSFSIRPIIGGLKARNLLSTSEVEYSWELKAKAYEFIDDRGKAPPPTCEVVGIRSIAKLGGAVFIRRPYSFLAC
jgi:hypothetical protein